MKKSISIFHDFFADEGLDFPIVDALRKSGFTVIYAAEEFIAASDKVILQTALRQKCILITKNKNSGQLVIRRAKAFTGYSHQNRKVKPPRKL